MIAAPPVPLRRNRDFILLQVGQLLSTTGTQATAIAYPLLVLAITHSPAKAGVVGFASIVPYALFGLLAGVAADRWNRKWLMLVTDGVRIVAIGSLVVALAAGHLTLRPDRDRRVRRGSAFVFFNIAEVGALRSVVPQSQLPDAAAAEQARYATVTLVGPLARRRALRARRAVPFLADGVSYVFSFVLARSRFARRSRRARARHDAAAHADRGRVSAWLWQQPFLRTCAMIFAGTNFIFQAIFLVYRRRRQAARALERRDRRVHRLFGASALARLRSPRRCVNGCSRCARSSSLEPLAERAIVALRHLRRTSTCSRLRPADGVLRSRGSTRS